MPFLTWLQSQMQRRRPEASGTRCHCAPRLRHAKKGCGAGETRCGAGKAAQVVGS